MTRIIVTQVLFTWRYIRKKKGGKENRVSSGIQVEISIRETWNIQWNDANSQP